MRGQRHDQRRGKPPGRSERDDGVVRLYGIHAVEAALQNPKRKVERLLLTENAEIRLRPVLAERQATPERVAPRDLDRVLGPDTVHQGALLETEPLEEPSLGELASGADAGGPLVVLDHVTDPHNVGAILRSCSVFGAAGLVMTRRHSPPLDGTLAKSASGALEHVAIALVQNLARSLAELKELGFAVLGLDDGADALIEEEAFDGRIALVLGAEGKGLRELTRTSCDRLCRIATTGPIASLNVSNAAAVTLHLGGLETAQRLNAQARQPPPRLVVTLRRSVADQGAPAHVVAAAAHGVAVAVLEAVAVFPFATARPAIAAAALIIVVVVVAAMARGGSDDCEAENAGSDAGGDAASVAGLRLPDRGGCKSGGERQRQHSVQQLPDHAMSPNSQAARGGLRIMRENARRSPPFPGTMQSLAT